ncbi:hypothetical protein H8356DRAFT_1002827 [Neocallimastix lanati (nom. inval.)]|nr:hypothetical protein H8356DRAFT_1002827 [Neocallimastix sp. JGI-2020a]
MLKKMNLKHILPLLFILSNKILSSSAQTNDIVTITDEQLDSFSYGDKEFKLAIIGDSGTEKEANKVMELTDFDALLHLGDYDYECDPDKYFEKVLDSDRSYQFMGVIGNHDAKHQCPDTAAEKFKNNVYNEMTKDKNDKVKCEFSESKFMWSCIYENMRIIGLTPGINGADKREEQLKFLKKNLSDATEDWKICSWHFYDKYYHTGKYPNDGNVVSGYDSDSESFYDYCKDNGAIIFSAHDHVYARTHVMSKFSTPEIDEYDKDSDGKVAQIRKGATLDILNGTGGWEIYIEQGEQKDYDHWVKKYALGEHRENAKRFGGLFCKFNYGGNNKRAHCEFLRINSSDEVFDTFDIYRNDDPGHVTYEQIDKDFKNEKIMAFKEATNSTNDHQRENLKANDGSNNGSINVDKIFTTKNIIIGGSVCAAIVIIGSSVLIFKKTKKIQPQSISDPELVIKY